MFLIFANPAVMPAEAGDAIGRKSLCGNVVQAIAAGLRTLLLCLLCLSWHAMAAPRPNIVIILSDDIGFSDIGCYGGEISTPNLDALAAGGLRFMQFYNTARCCPTRASLLTGLHPHQAGVGHMMENRGHDGYRGNLNRQCVTIAEALKPVGYRNYVVGKWHVTPGQTAKLLAMTNNWPLQRGFDRFYGTIHGAGSFFDPSSLVRDNQSITVANDPEYQPREFYYTDAIADHAVRFIREHARDQRAQPFFLYTAFTAAHWPLHAKTRDIAKYKGRYDGGYEPVRAARRAKLKQLGLLDERWAAPSPAEKWGDVKNKPFEARCMEVYAAQIDSMDQGIGRIIAELKAQGQFGNTLIFYLQDNGGCAELVGRGTNFTARGERPTLPPMGRDDQQYDSEPKQTRDGWPVRRGLGTMPGGPDTFVAYGRGWAQMSNTPFREYKHWTHEGGISTPLIAHWPEGMQPGEKAGGRWVHEPGQLVDIMATCLDVAGAKYPAEFNGYKVKPLEGASLRPVFVGKSIERTKPLVWEHEGNRAIRDGQWKLVAKENQPWELYDISADRGEQHNLAAAEPDRVKTMSAQWDAWADGANVRPLGAWRAKNNPKNTSSRGDSSTPESGRQSRQAWRTLFNGQDLTGWRANADPRAFTVTNGMLRAHATHPKNRGHLFYVGDRQEGLERFKDFELEVEARGEPNSNSGIFIHTDMTTRDKALHLAKGYEIQLNGSAREKRKTGSLYAVVDLAESPVDESQWFHARVTVRGQRITVHLNDRQVVDYTEPPDLAPPPERAGRKLDPAGGAIALQAHDTNSVFYFRNVRIRPL